MTHTYKQSTGVLTIDPLHKAPGYSGFGAGTNNPAMEAVHDVGPIPRGLWHLGPHYDDPHLGPCVMALSPVGHDAHGRTLFRIHGDNTTHDASHGCIVISRSVRRALAVSEDRDLLVIE